MTDETDPGIASVCRHRKGTVVAELFATFSNGETVEARIAEIGCPDGPRHPHCNQDSAEDPRTQPPIPVQHRGKGCRK